MFKIGDFIVYGSNGVCQVESIGSMDIKGVPNDRIYYTLIPVYTQKSKVFTPVDNNKVVMRPVLTQQEAYELIDHIKEMKSFFIEDEKSKDEIFKEAIKKCDCQELIRVIKTLYEKKIMREAQGKKVTAGDERYFKLAEESLYGELAIALGIKKEEVSSFIKERIS